MAETGKALLPAPPNRPGRSSWPEPHAAAKEAEAAEAEAEPPHRQS